MRYWLTVFFLFFASQLHAETGQPVVRVEVSPAQVMVGQPVRLRVTVLVPTWFTKPSAYPSFELANTITRLPPDSSFNTQARVDGESWTGIVRDYQINPQIAASYTLEGLSIRVNYAHPQTRQSTQVDVAVPPVRFSAMVPEGAAMLDPFLAGSNGGLRREVESDIEALQAGDAIVVTWTAELNGMPAMFLPELAPTLEQPGVASYPKEPTVEDGTTARRTEQVTYVFTGGGSFTLPAQTLEWWNPEVAQVERVTVQPLVLTVAGQPVSIVHEQETSDGPAWWDILMWIMGLGVVVVVAFMLRKAILMTRKWFVARMAAYRKSEPYAFRNMLGSAHEDDHRVLDRALREWLKRLPGQPSLQALSTSSGEPVYPSILAMNRQQHGVKQDGVVNQDGAKPSAAELVTQLKRARRSWLANQQVHQNQALPSLNPAAD